MKTLLVCGSGRTLFPDLQALGIDSEAKLQDFDTMAVNDAILALPTAQHFASLHGEKMESWLRLRRCMHKNGENIPDIRGIVTHSHRLATYVKQIHTDVTPGGTSSLFAVQVAIKLGYERIILCGVPMDDSGRWYEPIWHKAHDYKVTDGWDSWVKLHEAGTLEKVRSMAGCTRELLGEPPEDWYRAS